MILDVLKVCDEFPDCEYGEDEQNCPQINQNDDIPVEYDDEVQEKNNGIYQLICY